MTSRIPPAVVLFLLSPMIAELLSGSSPPAEFFNPPAFLLMTSLYGSGAIIVREIVVRWKKGWTSLFMLGAAYGILEEGLMVKSFFDPAWMDLGVLGTYGRWAGVNWVWATMLTIYHAAFSIAIPILIVQLIFPSSREYVWVSKRTLRLLVFLISAVTVVGFVWLTPYRPPARLYLGALFVVFGIVYAAWKLPYATQAPRVERKPVGAKRLAVLAFVATSFYFLILFAGPFLVPSPILTILMAAVLVAIVGMLLSDLGRRGLEDIHQFALAAGALGFLVLLAPLQELDRSRIDNPTGMTLVGVSLLVFLVALGYKIRRAGRASARFSLRSPP